MEITNYQLDQTGTWTIVASNSATVTGTAAYGLSLVLIPGATSSQDTDGRGLLLGRLIQVPLIQEGIRMPLHFMVNKAMALGIVMEELRH